MIVFKIILLHFWKFKWFIIPLALTFFFIAAMFSSFSDTDSFATQELNVTVVDQSHGEASNALIDYLAKTHNVETTDEFNRKELEEAVFLAEIHGAIILDQNFEENLATGEPAVEVIGDQRAAANTQLETELSKFLMFANAQINDSGSLDISKLDSALTDTIEVDINSDETSGNEADYNNVAAYSNFAAYWLMLFLMLSVGNLMSEYNQSEIQKRITVSPLSSTSNAIQVFTSQFIVSFLAVLIMFSGILVLYHGHLENVPLTRIFLAMILITVFTLAMQFAINALTTNRFMVNGLANLITLGMAFLSGIFIPLELFGDTAQKIAEFLPLYHYTELYRVPNTSWSEVIPSIIILLLYTVAFMIIGIIFNNQRKSKQS